MLQHQTGGHDAPNHHPDRLTRRAALALAFMLPASVALAHHGWSWAMAEPETMEAVIETVSLAPPHPGLMVRAEDGTLWEIDFTNPAGSSVRGSAKALPRRAMR